MKGIFLDIETTGLDPSQHLPIDIAFKIIDLSTGKIDGSYESIIRISEDAWNRKDPASIEINGFTWAEIEKGKNIFIVGHEIVNLLTALNVQRGNSVFICQNPAFYRGFFNQIVPVYQQEQLNWPYHWLDLASMFWAMLVHQSKIDKSSLPQKMSLSKNDIAAVYHLQPESTPHRAMKGVDHLITCYQAVLELNWKEES
jgi:oligoribonuclease